jgi:hypothetical protein
VTGIDPAPGSAPFDLVLGESINSGWKATVVGGPSLGTPVLIDGFANGWRIDPAAVASAVHHGTLEVALTWVPQRRVDVALLVSAATVVVCLVLAFLPGRWRRRRRPASEHDVAVEEGAQDGVGAVTPLPEQPVLATPFRAEAPPATVWVALVAGVVAGGVAASISSVAAGLGVAVALIAVLLLPRLRVVLGLAAIAGVVAAGAYVAVHQAQTHVPAGGDWTMAFATAATLTWAGVVFLGADAVADVILRRPARPRRAPGADMGAAVEADGPAAEPAAVSSPATSSPATGGPVPPSPGPPANPGRSRPS